MGLGIPHKADWRTKKGPLPLGFWPCLRVPAPPFAELHLLLLFQAAPSPALKGLCWEAVPGRDCGTGLALWLPIAGPVMGLHRHQPDAEWMRPCWGASEGKMEA